MTPNETLAVLSIPGAAVVAGAIPGIWLGHRRRNPAGARSWLAAVVAILAVAAVTVYTVTGAKEELFSRVVMLPLTLLIAVVAAAALVGVPVFVGYVVGHRIGSRLSGGA